jgi:hypothetical protein
VIAVLLAWAAALAPSPELPLAPTSTIAQVRADPERWDGRWVRVEGWITRCTVLDCALVDRPDGKGQRLGFESSAGFDDWIQSSLPARVIVVARIDARCLIGICTDRAPDLREAHVQLSRRNIHFPKKD